jgi:hypothetical protein
VKRFLASWIEGAVPAREMAEVSVGEVPVERPNAFDDRLAGSKSAKLHPLPERREVAPAYDVAAMSDVQMEIAGILAAAYRRFSRIQSESAGRQVSSRNDGVANSLSSSVHGSVP